MSRLTRATAVALTLVLSLQSPAADDKAKGKFEVVTLPDAATDFAIHPESGTVAVVRADSQEVTLYPDLVSKRTADNAKTVKVGRKPSAIVFKKAGKKNFFVVLATEETAMFVLDADKGTVLEKIPLQLNYLRSLIVSANPNDPYAYYCGGAGHDCRIARINLEKMTNEGVVQGTDSVAQAAISGDGTILYTHGPWGPSGFKSVAIDPPGGPGKGPTARPLFYEHTSVGSYLPDPFGQYVICDGRVLSPDLKKLQTKVAVAPAFISQTRPLLVAPQQDQVVFLSANTFEQIGTIDLPAELRTKQDRFAPRFEAGPHTRFLEHHASQTLLVCRGKTVAVLALKDAGLPEEPFLALTTQGPTALNVGKPQQIELQLRDPSVKVEVKDGPAGLKLDGQKLVWTPGGGDVGAHTVTLRLSAGKVTLTRDVTLTVRRPAVDLGFVPGQLALAADGATALLLGGEGQPAGPPGFPQPQEGGQARLALVDLEKLNVATERKLLVPIRRVALDKHFVYAAAGASDVLYVLNRKDLADVKRIFTNGRVNSIVPVGERLLFVATDANQQLVLKLPDLTPAEPADVGTGIHLTAKGDSRSKTPPTLLGSGWWYDGVLYDADLAKPLALGQPAGFWSNQPSASPSPFPEFQPPGMRPGYPAATTAHPTWVSPWSVTLTGNGFQHGKRFAQLGSPNADPFTPVARLLLAEHPAVVVLRSSTTGGGTTAARARVALQFFDLIAGGMNLELALQDEPQTNQNYSGQGMALHLQERAGKIAAVCNRQLFVVPIPALEADKFQPPMHFEARQPLRVLDEKADTMPLPKLVGGKAPVEITFRRDVPGVDLDAKAQTLRFDREALIREATKAAEAALGRARGVGGKPIPPEEVLTEYARETAVLFPRITGAKATGVPVWVSVGLVARDQNLQTAETELGLFVEVPLDELTRKAKAMRPEQPPAVVFDPQRPPTLMELMRAYQQMEEKVTRLERQIGDLQETINRLNRNLEKKGDGKP